MRVPPGDTGRAAYHWAPLTSGSKWFALWPLLLPFTVINVAGYMRPEGGRVRGFLAERLVQTLALATTVAWVGWATITGEVVLRNQSLSWAGDVLGAVLVVLPFVVAGTTRRTFEAVRPSPIRGRGDIHENGRRLLDPGFFDGRAHLFAAWMHAAVAAFALIGIVWAANGEAGGSLRVGGDVIVGAGMVQAALVLALAIVTFRWRRGWWRGSPAASAAGLGVILLGGLVSAGLQWSVGSCPAKATGPDRPEACTVLAGKPWMLVDLFGWALVVMIGVAGAVVVHTLRQPRAGERDEEMLRLLPTWLSRIRARIALLPSRLAPVLALAVATFFVGGGPVFAARAWPTGVSELCAELPVLDSRGPCAIAEDRAHAAGETAAPWVLTDSPPVTIARWAFLGLLGFMGVNLVKSRAAPDVLRRVGQLWDVLGFWPRRFHPLAVRPYAERVVPELQQLLVERPDVLGSEKLVVTAHCQGSVLAVAALAPYKSVGHMRLLTAGSPIRVLFSHLFPHYFNDDLTTSVCRTLGPGQWQNAFRFTDHIGRSVFAPDEPWSAHEDEVPLPDPASRGAQIAGHGHYWRDAAVLGLVAAWSRDEVEAPDA